jgi:hypothetical protein
VDGILTVIGGFNSNQLLTGIDYSLVAAHPKVMCGFSDITVLSTPLRRGERQRSRAAQLVLCSRRPVSAADSARCIARIAPRNSRS